MARLRDAQAKPLATMPQEEVVTALAELAARWRDPACPLRREAEGLVNPFPFAMVQVSLDALLDSLTPSALWQLIDSEGARDAAGYLVIGHVIAANTPLLAWVSIIRALLVRSASLVKLPSGPAAEWGRLFHRTLTDVSPRLAACVYLAQWPGGTSELDAALCRSADLVMAHGSDETIGTLKALCPSGTPFVGYGHRVSFGVVPQGMGTISAALGLAKDVLLYDQGGCLSPQTVYVEGGWKAAREFAVLLAEALASVSEQYPLPIRAECAAMTVREARGLARMAEGNHFWEDPNLRWTVIARPHSAFAPSPTFGIVSVQPLKTLEELPEALAPIANHLQGCAVAGKPLSYLPGLSRLCKPGELQAPPLAWRQDGRDVLRVLLPQSYRAEGRTTTCISAGSVSSETVRVGVG